MCSLFFFNGTSPTEIYTLSLHDALPISQHVQAAVAQAGPEHLVVPQLAVVGQAHPVAGDQRPPVGERVVDRAEERIQAEEDRKSTRLNSSHVEISYAVFCLKKKKKKINS